MGMAADFFLHQIRALARLSPEVHGKWDKSWLIGLSCWFYALPGILCFCLYPPSCRFATMEGTLYTLTAINSFLSDYVYVGKRHFSHATDRIFATLSAVSIFSKIFTTTYRYGALSLNEFASFVALWVAALWMLSKSRRSSTQTEFIRHHFVWHLISSLGMCWIIWVECIKYNM